MSAVRTPATREELAELLRAASAEGTPVGIHGGGSASRRGPVTDPPARAISTAGLARILSHEPADLTVTVEAGCPLAELQAALAARGQTWMQAGARPGATVGGVLSTAASSHRRLRYGPVRDSLLQVVLATGDGRIISAGGKTVKGVAGYDIPRLVVGALGTLGVIVEVTLKLWPVPASSGWFTATGDVTRLAELGEALRRELHLPAAVLLEPGRLSVEVIGPPADLVPPDGMAAGDAPAAPAWDAEMTVGVPPTRLPALAADLEALGLPYVAELGVGTCRVGVATPGHVAAVRDTAIAHEGHAVVADAPPELREDPWGPPPPGVTLMGRLRDAFDPAHILNPGLFIGDAVRSVA